MSYKCLECGHIFEEGEQRKFAEDRGECFGAPCVETFYGCPLCAGGYQETKACKSCGIEHLSYELDADGFCEECAEE